MIKPLLKIFIPLGLMAVMIFQADITAASESMSEMELIMLERINQGRLEPVETAARLGAKPRSAAYLEGLSLLPLMPNALLQGTASDHSRDMLANGYFSKTALDGRGFDERIAASGYAGAATGESIAVITFRNFIEPRSAVELLFSRLFLKALSLDDQAANNLLNPAFGDVGISIASGVLTLGGVAYNVYLAACDFGVQRRSDPDTLAMADQLENLLNQARAGDAMSINMGLPPLRRDADLDRAAAEIADQTLGDPA